MPLNDADKELDFRIEPADEHTLLEKLSTEEIGVAKWVQKNNKHAGATTNTLPDSKWLFLFRAGHPRRDGDRRSSHCWLCGPGRF